MQNAFSTSARMMPTESHHSVAQAVMMFIGDAVLDLLLDASIPAYNLYALQRLNSDVLQLKAFADASGIPHMAVSPCLAFVPFTWLKLCHAHLCLSCNMLLDSALVLHIF